MAVEIWHQIALIFVLSISASKLNTRTESNVISCYVLLKLILMGSVKNTSDSGGK